IDANGHARDDEPSSRTHRALAGSAAGHESDAASVGRTAASCSACADATPSSSRATIASTDVFSSRPARLRFQFLAVTLAVGACAPLLTLLPRPSRPAAAASAAPR